jgi:DNA polymerase phi
LFELVSNACDGKIVVAASQMKELLKLGLLAIRQTKRVISTPERLPAIWQPATWDALGAKLATSDRYASVAFQTMCQGIVQASQISVEPTKSRAVQGDAVAKRKVEDTGAQQPVVSTKSKRRKVKNSM